MKAPGNRRSPAGPPVAVSPLVHAVTQVVPSAAVGDVVRAEADRRRRGESMDDQSFPSKRYATTTGRSRCRLPRPRDRRRTSRPSGARTRRHRRPAAPEARSSASHAAARGTPRPRCPAAKPHVAVRADQQRLDGRHVVRDRHRGAHPPGPTQREPVERVLRDGVAGVRVRAAGSEPARAGRRRRRWPACPWLQDLPPPVGPDHRAARVATATAPSAERASPSTLPDPAGTRAGRRRSSLPPRTSQSRSHAAARAGPSRRRRSTRWRSGRGVPSVPGRTRSRRRTPSRRPGSGTCRGRSWPPRSRRARPRSRRRCPVAWPSPSTEAKTRASVPSNRATFEQQLPSSEATTAQTEPSSAAVSEVAPIGWPLAPGTLVHRPSKRCTGRSATPPRPTRRPRRSSRPPPPRSVPGIATDPSVAPVESTWTRSTPVVNQMVPSGDTASRYEPSPSCRGRRRALSHVTPFQRCGADWYDVAHTEPVRRLGDAGQVPEGGRRRDGVGERVRHRTSGCRRGPTARRRRPGPD